MDEHSKTLYNQVYREIVGQIRSGALANGARLLPERELCARYRVSRITIRQALGRLERDGFIFRRQGRGTYIRSGLVEHRLNRLYRLRDELGSQHVRYEVKILSFETGKADGLVAQKLRLSDLAPVYQLKRLIMADGQPLTIETSYLPAAIFIKPLDQETLSTHGLYESLKLAGLPPTRAYETLRVQSADQETSKLLNCKKGDPCMQIARSTESSGLMVEYTINLIRSDLFEYSVELL